jgi:hypothetical protein
VSGSMVLPGYQDSNNVTAPYCGTSVLRSRNLRTIGQPDRWWQNSSIEPATWPLDVWLGHGVEFTERSAAGSTSNWFTGR